MTKKRKPNVFTIKRSQIRPDSLQQPNSDEPVLDDKLTKSAARQKSAVINDFFDNNNTGMRAVVMEHAKELQQSLDASFPSFVKQLVRSNVAVGFTMHLPVPFCKSHLPTSDVPVTLDVVNGSKHDVLYIADRTSLSSGWAKFCSMNRLHEGDVLVFHMLGPFEFKIYVVRSSDIFKGTVDLAKVEKQINPVRMDAEPDQNNHHNPSSPPPPVHSSTKFTIYTNPNKHKTKKRKSRVFTIRRSQIQPESPQQSFSAASDGPVLDDKLTNSALSYKQKSAVINDFFDYNNTGMRRTVVMEHARELQQSLDASFPSFLKQLVPSNVKVGSWMHLPAPFCKLHLPKTDVTVALDVVNGRKYKTLYIAYRTSLSTGWGKFCSMNGLHEGDVLVFHMLGPFEFKVYIVRSSDIFKGTEDLPKVENETNLEDSAEPDGETNERAENLMTMDLNETENQHDSARLENFTSLATAVDFKDVDIENFSILINGSAIDSEITDQQKTKYYELCCSQNSYLHENLLQSINYKLATEIIIGVVNISEAIGASKLSISGADFAVWDKTLKGFELLGMNVGFLRSRLNRLMSLAKEAEEAAEAETREIRQQEARIDEEIRSIELKLMDLRGSRERLDGDIESTKPHAERHERKFQEAVNARW